MVPAHFSRSRRPVVAALFTASVQETVLTELRLVLRPLAPLAVFVHVLAGMLGTRSSHFFLPSVASRPLALVADAEAAAILICGVNLRLHATERVAKNELLGCSLSVRRHGAPRRGLRYAGALLRLRCSSAEWRNQLLFCRR